MISEPTHSVQKSPPNPLEDLLQDMPGGLERLAAMDPVEKAALQVYVDEVGAAIDQLDEAEIDALLVSWRASDSS